MSLPEGVVRQHRAVGDPAYSDVGRVTEWKPTYGEARADGLRILLSGNWKRFTIEQTYVRIES